MEKRQSHVSEKILAYALEIIYLLTGEKFPPLKNSDQLTFTEPPPHYLRNEKKILDVIQKMMELLTGEVPIRCRDVTVYFSMEEWEYLEGHKDLYKDVMMEDVPDGFRKRNPPQRCPRPPEGLPIPGHDQDEDPIRMKVKIEEKEDGGRHGGDLQSTEGFRIMVVKEEESSLDNPEIHPKLHVPEKSLDPSNPEGPSSSTLDSSSHKDHEKNECSDVNEGFASQSTLAFDKMTNGGKIPYSCFECGKCFYFKGQLLRHQRCHTEERPFPCSQCGKGFIWKADLLRHQKCHSGERPFSCLQCSKCFKHKADLLRHQRSHTGERPFSCSQCVKCFTRKDELLIHQKTHRTETSFPCLECGQTFSRKTALPLHRRIHTNQRSFSCLDCGKSFILKGHLIRHQKRHNGEHISSAQSVDKV